MFLYFTHPTSSSSTLHPLLHLFRACLCHAHVLFLRISRRAAEHSGQKASSCRETVQTKKMLLHRWLWQEWACFFWGCLVTFEPLWASVCCQKRLLLLQKFPKWQMRITHDAPRSKGFSFHKWAAGASCEPAETCDRQQRRLHSELKHFWKNPAAARLMKKLKAKVKPPLQQSDSVKWDSYFYKLFHWLIAHILQSLSSVTFSWPTCTDGFAVTSCIPIMKCKKAAVTGIQTAIKAGRLHASFSSQTSGLFSLSDYLTWRNSMKKKKHFLDFSGKILKWKQSLHSCSSSMNNNLFSRKVFDMVISSDRNIF